MQHPTTSRQAYLDWLRILAIIGVLVFHSAMAFVAEWEWHIKNKETSNLLMEFNFWLSRFRMPLLFFISGTVCYFMLRKKSGWSFVGLRFKRLFIPLVVGMLVIVPPQVYMERLTQGFTGNYFTDFYPTLFTTGAYPKGNLSWHHLWFIAYLFVYDVTFTPMFVWILSEKGKRFLQKLNWMAKGKWIYLLMIPSVILYTSLTLSFPRTDDLIHDYMYLFYWLFFLLAGFICIAHPHFTDSLERNRRTSLTLAFLTIVAINYLRWNDLEPFDNIVNWRSDWRSYAFLSLFAFTAWFWVFTAIGYGKRYLNKPHRALDYLNQAVYPFYILHQTVIIILVYYVVQVQETIISKYLFTVILSFLISMLLLHLFIRPFKVMRFLFGMKPKAGLKDNKSESPKEKPLPEVSVEPVV
jgi:peptidoglycan/LPS O-acetylase OafA/YrhL